MRHMKLLDLPTRDLADLPKSLRNLADAIEAGEYDDAYHLAWCIDCGDGRIEVGLIGQTPEPGAIAHYLFALAQRKLESVAR